MTYKQSLRKFKIEKLLSLPFVWLGRLLGYIFPLKTEHNIFLFFPNADIGGSPQVNIDISNCITHEKPVIIFSKKPKNNQFDEKFKATGVRIIDLHQYIDHKWLHFLNFIYRGIIATWINRRDKPVVFGGECMFFYKIIQHVKKETRCVELCHLPTWLNYNIGLINRIDLRIFSTLKLKEQVIALYSLNGVEPQFYERLLFVDNAIDIPAASVTDNELLEVVFIGRGSPQKRVYLTAEVAEVMHKAGDKVHFSFVGDVEQIIDITRYPFCKFYGNVNDQVLMDEMYEKSDVLILTSAFEGLPIVIMKMMAAGRVVLSTAVNGIPDYIEHMKNGLLIFERDEPGIVASAVSLLRLLLNQADLKQELGTTSRRIATEKFSRQAFCSTYTKILSHPADHVS